MAKVANSEDEDREGREGREGSVHLMGTPRAEEAPIPEAAPEPLPPSTPKDLAPELAKSIEEFTQCLRDWTATLQSQVLEVNKACG